MASQVDDDAASHEHLVPSLHEKPEKFCVACGEGGRVALCSRCKGVWYCNMDCQRNDWRCHRILCSKYAKVNQSEPLKDEYRAFLFRCDSMQPEIVILPSSKKAARPFDSVAELLRKPGDDDARLPTFERIEFAHNDRYESDSPFLITNPHRHRIGKHRLQVTVRAECKLDGSKSNKSLLNSLRSVGTEYPPSYWAGNIIVRRILPSTSVTMADFRHALDWFAEFRTYPQGTPAYFMEVPWTFNEIKGVVIAGDQHIKNESERYRAVTVPANHCIRGLQKQLVGHISPISKRVDRPLRLFLRLEYDDWRKVDKGDYQLNCGPIAAFMRSLDTDTSLLPKEVVITLYDEKLPPVGQALIVRSDDKDLSVDEVKAMAHFSESMCRDVIRGIAMTSQEDKPGMETAKHKASEYMTWNNYLVAFDELGIPRPEPAEEAFVDGCGLDLPDLE